VSRLIKIIDENTIELAEYKCPEVIFKNSQTPPTLQNIKDEIEHLEWYCTFKDTINPFQMYAENERLHSIIKEVREYIETKEKDDDNWVDYELLIEPIKIKEILDKGSEKE
jgi:hypothetical protein